MPNVVVYTRDYCGFCMRAIQLLQNKGIAFTEHNASKDRAKRAEMIERSGRSTFPQVFVGDRHIGGCDDLFAAERSGMLDQVLESAS
ncbi:MAG: glutaredoxin 3 [Pseudomonadota bacterium]